MNKLRSTTRQSGATTINSILALVLVTAALALFGFIIHKQFGGEQALFLILGHVAAWIEMVVIFYFRKKPNEDNKTLEGKK